jgi:hypothetical protein
LILSGYKIAYVAEACVYHSHSYMVLAPHSSLNNSVLRRNVERIEQNL